MNFPLQFKKNIRIDSLVGKIDCDYRLLGSGDIKVDSISAPSTAQKKSLVGIFSSNVPEAQYIAEKTDSLCIIATQGIEPITGKTLIEVDKPRNAISIIIGWLINNDMLVYDESTFSPQARILTGCTITGTVAIGSFVTINEGAVIGSESILYSRQPLQARWIKFPAIGGVILQESVDIGAGSVICRGVLSDTIIQAGTKIGPLCWIGSGVNLGENVWISGGVRIGGGVTIGDNTQIGMGACVRNGISIGA